ncbi:protein SYS1 homolog [Gigantopelta aegis]|uniref:protein SYS1 homolog n=1 Tax=Gigantopelta aegis TaxID=1735272 RepID=UPI001B887C31|nr:protein SYS1 homolog [Gigantopelta aegis]
MLGLLRRQLNKQMAGHFRSNVWDPVLILSQIVSMQSIFYIMLGFWIYVLDLIGRFDLSLEQLFSQVDLGLYEDSARTNVIAYTLNSLTCALGLWLVVRKTKQCLDFAATVHLLHFVSCWIYGGHVPQTFWWWLTNIVSMTLMTVLGEFLCMRTELKAIPVGMGPKVDL